MPLLDQIKTKSFGTVPASPWSMLPIKSVHMAGDGSVNSLKINDKFCGGPDGVKATPITLVEGEYINNVVVYSGQYINYLEFKTNKGQSISAGSHSGDKVELSNIKLLGMIGSSGLLINQLEFTYEQEEEV